MRTATILLVPLLAVTALAGCLDDGDSAALDATPTDSAGTPGSGDAASHAAASRDDGAVEIDNQNGRVRASQTITISNDFGGASRAITDLNTRNGDIIVAAGGDGGYHFEVEIWADGATENAARDNLAAIEVAHGDHLDDGTLHLNLEVIFGNVAANPLALLLGGGGSRGGSITLLLPDGPAHDLHGQTENGAASLNGLHGDQFGLFTSNGDIAVGDVIADQVALATSNGAVAFQGSARQIEAVTDNGAIAIDGHVGDAHLQTRNGDVAGAITPVATGTIGIATSNGNVALALATSDDHGYDARGETNNGRVVIELPDTATLESGDALLHVRTSDFDDRAIQTTLLMETDNAGILVTSQ